MFNMYLWSIPGVGEAPCELPPVEGLEELLAIVFSGKFQPENRGMSGNHVTLAGQRGALWTFPETLVCCQPSPS